MKKFLHGMLVGLGAAAVGFINGFFGGGGGMLLVPLLEKTLKCPVKNSHATAIAIILPVSIAGAVTYIMGGFFSGVTAIAVSGGSLAGGVTGALLLKKLPAPVVALVFAAIMIAVGVRLSFF